MLFDLVDRAEDAGIFYEAKRPDPSGKYNPDGTPVLVPIEEYLVESNPDDPPDPVIVKAIREIDPSYVPLWLIKVYKSPAGTEIKRGYHVIGRWLQHPSEDLSGQLARPILNRPDGVKYNINQIYCIRTLWVSWEKGSPEYDRGEPPAFVPYGWHIHERIQILDHVFHRSDASTSDELRKLLEKITQTEIRTAEKAFEEARYVMRHNWPQMKRALDEGRINPTPTDRQLYVQAEKVWDGAPDPATGEL